MPTRFSIDRFLNIRSATGPTFSPDGRFVAFLTNITGVMQLWQVPVEGGWPTQLTFANESVRSAHYSPIRHEIAYSMDTGGNERTQLYLLKGVGVGTDHGIGDGWISENLTNHPEAIHTFGGWSHDGERIAFAANREKPDRFDIYVQKIGDRQAQLLARGPGGYYTAHGWSPDDKHLLVSYNESNFNQDLFIIDVGTGKVRHLTLHKEATQYHSACWSANGKYVFCGSTAENRELAGLARIEITSGKLVYLAYLEATPKHEVEAVLTSPKGELLAWLENADGRSEFFLGPGGWREPDKQDPKKAVVLPAPSVLPGIGGLPQGVISHLEFSRDGSKLAVVFDGPRHNMDVWIMEVAKEKFSELTNSSRAGIPFSQFLEPQLIHYKTFDDRKIPAWFYQPAIKPDQLPPVIVYPHGGPESQTRPNFNAIFQYFIQAGYAILAPNVRGSTGYGTAYMNLDNTTKRMDSVKDLAYAAYWLRDQKKGDPKRLAVFGGSYGGFMVLAQVTHYPELWAAGIDVVGIANWITFMEKTGAYRRAHREAEYGNLREHREFLEKISPINHVDKIRCPMMVIHGANDPRVPIAEAEQIVAALRKRNIPVEYLRYEDEGHGLAKLKNRLDAYPKMVTFLDKYLK
ncbi:MAG TPA: S9 family peptidase [Gemmataceae bacterium]|nr:S9 family peptidase [Gemmataceae bacterium]